MQIGPGPGGFERGGLRGPAARDDRVRRPYVGDGGELFAAQLVGGEAEQSDAPVPAGQALGGLGEQFAYIMAVHHGEGEKGQPARVGHRPGEGGPVADAGHGPLGNGQMACVRARLKGPGPYRSFEMAGDGGPHGLYDGAGGAVA